MICIIETSKNDFTFMYVIGRGGFGKVWKVEQKKTHSLYAMKEMQKARVLAKKSVHSVMNETVQEWHGSGRFLHALGSGHCPHL